MIAQSHSADRQLPESTFRGLVECAPDAIVVVDAAGSIVLVNAQTEQLFGYTRDALLGQPVEVLVPRAVHDKHPAYRDGYVAEPRARAMGVGLDLYGRRKDGEEFPVEISLSPLQTEAGLLVSAAIRDITDRKRAELTLQQKNVELQNASETKDRFLDSMSHELRTPLNAIIGFTGTLLMKLPGPLTDDQDKQLHTIQTSAKHLLGLINDLLDLAKIESGKVRITLEPVVCQSVISEVASMLRASSEQKGLAFDVQVPDAEVVAQTDRRALSQILFSFLTNAVKFTERGTVSLRLTRRSDNGRSFVEVSVHDTGPGIKAEDQARLFEAFASSGGPAGFRAQGAGLGLHLSQRLAEIIGGHITFASAVGRGSTFSVLIPEN